MKTMRTILQSLALALLSSVMVTARAGTAPAATNASPVAPRSVFVVPATTKEGRDPFYPESTRSSAEQSAAAAAAAATRPADVTSLTVPGISGTPGHWLVTINNHTFGVGDEGEVVTASGRVRLRCLDIRPDSVTVEVNGQIHRLSVKTK